MPNTTEHSQKLIFVPPNSMPFNSQHQILADGYLYIFIVVDSRSQNFGEYSYKGLSSELRSTIDGTISVSSLAARVGLIKFDFTQPMDYAPLGVGAFGGSLERLARCADQPRTVTKRLAALGCVVFRAVFLFDQRQ